MDRWRGCYLLTVFLALGAAPLVADHPPAGKVRIVGANDQDFATIQAAIDEAPAGATILIGEGRYDERLTIAKPITLIGAGADKTVVGPTAEARVAEDAALLTRIVESQTPAPGKKVDPEERAAAIAEVNLKSGPIIAINQVQGVELRSLRVTSPGTLKPKTRLRNGYSAIEVRDGGLRLSDCAVVGCRTYGVWTRGKLKLDVENCLVAGCSTGILAIDPGPGWMKIRGSDLRNCHRANVWVGKSAGDVTIEDCRLSGTSEWSISLDCAAAIRRNAIFDNAQVGIDVDGDGDCAIQQNLFYKNQVAVDCSTGARSQVTGNLFLDNKDAAVRGRGESESLIRRNVFVGSDRGVVYCPHPLPNGLVLASDKYFIRENIFWRTGVPARRYDQKAKNGPETVTSIDLPARDKNRILDPLLTLDAAGNVVLADDSPAREINLANIVGISLKSRWPTMEEEQRIVEENDWHKTAEQNRPTRDVKSNGIQ